LQFNMIADANHDAKVKLKKVTLECFSSRYLKNTYPQGGCKVLGEVAGGKKRRELGAIVLSGEEHSVSPAGEHSRLLWRTAGYLRVGQDEYVALLKSRVPFLIILFALLAAIVVLALLLMPNGEDIPAGPQTSDPPGGSQDIGDDTPGGSQDIGDDTPAVIAPDRPLPDVDSNANALEGDTSEKADAAEGGGSVTMIYMLDVTVTLSTGEITMYFQNPNASTHNVVLDMYIISNDQEYLVAQSGLLEAGYGLYTMELMENAPSLSEGG